MADERPPAEGPKADENASWAEWMKPARWLAFAQRVFRFEKELLEIKSQNAEFGKRIRELERALDRQSGHLAQLDRYIDAKVALEVQKALELRAGKLRK